MTLDTFKLDGTTPVLKERLQIWDKGWTILMRDFVTIDGLMSSNPGLLPSLIILFKFNISSGVVGVKNKVSKVGFHKKLIGLWWLDCILLARFDPTLIK